MINLLILANGLIFILEVQNPQWFLPLFALWPVSPYHDLFQPWQLLTYAFLHGSLAHLLFNMYALWLFGTRMEYTWGSLNLLYYYLACVLGAAVMQLIVTGFSGEIYPTVGASGGVYGILLAFGLTYPNERLMLLIPPVVLKAKWLVLIFGAIELTAGIMRTDSGIAHFAHLGGMLAGWLMILYWRTHPPRLH